MIHSAFTPIAYVRRTAHERPDAQSVAEVGVFCAAMTNVLTYLLDSVNTGNESTIVDHVEGMGFVFMELARGAVRNVVELGILVLTS